MNVKPLVYDSRFARLSLAGCRKTMSFESHGMIGNNLPVLRVCQVSEFTWNAAN